MILYQKIYRREDLKANPTVWYVFGDNDARTGLGGQAAECRGEPNAIGIRTKKRPSREDSAYWTDASFVANCAKLDEDFALVIGKLRQGRIVVLPLDGIGTGLSKMAQYCPRTFEYLNRKIDSLKVLG